MMAPMSRKIFPAPEDAEAAFYDAFERCNLTAMMAVWASEEHISCIHPQGPHLTGFESIRASWAEIFSANNGFKLQINAVRSHHDRTLAIRTVCETLSVPGSTQTAAPILATNVFILTPEGWRLVLHHASVIPPDAAELQNEARILH
jgi:ketosteroid isomerase-like protein